MRVKVFVYIFGVVFFVSSCGVFTRGPVKPAPFDPAIGGYIGDLKPTFYYTEGIKSALMYGDTERAVKLFDKAIELDSMHSPSYFEAANTLIATDAARALEYSIKANTIDTTNLWYQTQLGRLMLMTENYNKAFSIYQNLIRELPSNPDNYRLLAALYQENKQPFSAITILDSAEYKVGRIEELASFKRQLLMDVQLYDKAIEESRALIRDYPFKEDNYVILAELYAITKKDSLALATYDKALALNPTNADVLASLNDYYKSKGDNLNFLATAKQIFINNDVALKSKIDFFKKLTKDKQYYTNYYLQLNDLASTIIIKYPNDYDALDLYADHLIASGGLDQALELYKSRVNDSIPNIEVFNNILDIEAYLNHPDSVAKYSELALRAFPSNIDLYIRKGSILSYLKQEDAALALYKESIKHTTNDSIKSVIYGIIGDIHHVRKEDKTGYRQYDRALKLDSSNVSVLNNYSYFLSSTSSKRSDLEKSLKMIEKAVELTPSNPTFLDSHAWVLYKLGRYEEAKKIMQQAISLDRQGNSELFIHYGDILYELKEYFMASVYWNKAAEKGYDKAQIESRMKLIEGK